MKEFWERLKNTKRLVDFGYVSYPKGLFQDFWWRDQLEYSADAVTMDRNPSSRKDVFPDYKAGRKKRRITDEQKQKRELVKTFRIRAEENPILFTLFLDGYEADDLVGLIWLYYLELGKPRPVVAVDKDLRMLPGISEWMINHLGEETNAIPKTPKYANAPKDLTPLDRVCLQVLFGDKSDSIPRLLSSTGSVAKKEWEALDPLNRDRAPTERLAAIYAQYGDDLIRNLRLILIPEPGLRNPVPTDYQLLRLVASGNYWRCFDTAWKPSLELVGQNYINDRDTDSPW